MAIFQEAMARAAGILRELHPRANYGQRVIAGSQAWSGADLRGKAKRYGGGYARQRSRARFALHTAGGALIPLAPAGRVVAAVYLGMDDYGSPLFATADGTARLAGSTVRFSLV